jgi:hypothetical protein
VYLDTLLYVNFRFLIRPLMALAILAGAIVVGFGVPLVWLWIGAKIQGVSGVTHMTKSTALAMFPGVAITYAMILHVAARARASRLAGSGVAPPPRRMSWNRSMRDDPHDREPPTALERMFIVAASFATIACLIWFFAYAKSPI